MGPLRLDNAYMGNGAVRHQSDKVKDSIDIYSSKPGRIKSLFVKTIAVRVNSEEGNIVYIKKRSAEKYIRNHINDLPGEKKKRSYKNDEIRRLLPIIFNKKVEGNDGFRDNPAYDGGGNPFRGNNPVHDRK